MPRALLAHGFAFAGLIGSSHQMGAVPLAPCGAGHSPRADRRITCPIGDPNLGKHPQMIAVGVAAQLLRHNQVQNRTN